MQIPYKRLISFSLFATVAAWALTSIVAQVEEQAELPQNSSPLAKVNSQQLVPQPAAPKEASGPAATKEDLKQPDMPQEDQTQPTQSEELNAFILAQLKDIRTQDLSKAYYAYTGTEFQKNVPLETFKIFMRTSPGFANNRSFELQNISYKGVIASVKGVLIDANDRKTSVNYDLIQENGQWKIRKLDVFSPNGPSAK